VDSHELLNLRRLGEAAKRGGEFVRLLQSLEEESVALAAMIAEPVSLTIETDDTDCTTAGWVCLITLYRRSTLYGALYRRVDTAAGHSVYSVPFI
jgi:hypothetical protein